MTENIEIGISTKLDASGLEALRKGLNDQRNELNAVARELDKTDKQYKTVKATVSELNRIMKLSDDGLRKYASSLVQVEQGVTKVSTAKGKLLTNTDKLTKSFTNLKTNVGQYSSTLVNLTSDIASGDKSMLQSIGTLGLYAGGWLAVASGIFLATKNLVDWSNTNSEAVSNNQIKNSPSSFNFDTPTSKFFPETALPLLPSKEGFLLNKKDNIKVNTGGNGALQKTASIIVEKTQQDLYLEMLKKANENLGFSKSARIESRTLTLLQRMNLPLGNNAISQQQIPSLVPETFGETASQTLDDTNAIYSTISQSMSLLGVGTNTFVSQLVSGFGTVLQIMEIIKSVNSVLSIIPGFASGGMATGTFIAGERGAELINVGSNSARVYNNSDTMRILNNNVNNAPDIYISSNINPAYIEFVVDKKRAGQVYTRR